MPPLFQHLSTAALALLAAALVTLSGCASQVDGEWSDPQLSAGSLRGARVMVACEADEVVVKRLCTDQLAAAVKARGATAVLAPDALINAPANTQGDEPYLAAARENNARALLTTRVTPAASSTSPGFRLGLGGFGFGGGGISTGVGVSAPIGGGEAHTSYAANARVLESNGKLLWTAKASAGRAGANDIKAQLEELSQTIFVAIDKAGLF